MDEPEVAAVSPPVETPSPRADAWESDSIDASDDTQPEPVMATQDEPVAGERELAAPPATPEPKKKRDNPYTRVKDATAEAARERDARAAAEKKAAELEDRLRLMEQQRQQPAPEAPKPAATRAKPTEYEVGTKYASYGDFVEDLSDWKAEQRLSGLDIDGRVNAMLASERQKAAWTAHCQGTVDKGVAAYPDFKDKILASTQVFPVEIGRMIISAPGSEHIQYALASDPALAARIARIDNPFALGLELAALVQSSGAVARPDSALTTRVSTASPPINRVGGAASAVALDPDDLDFGPDYIKAENAREKKRAEANRW